MHPALSVIIFTTLTGFGYGLAALLGIAQPDAGSMAVKISYVLAFGMISAGLLSSTLHLGNPQRAWRAFSQWRSSWLSREGVLAVITFVPLTLQTASALFLGETSSFMGWILALLCAATVFATSMIYASLKSVHGWNSRLTTFGYLAIAAAGGALGLSATTGQNAHILLSILLLIVAFIIKYSWWQRLDREVGPSTPESATGLGHIGAVRLLERPHVNENYLNKEMGFRIARQHARKLRRLTFVFGLIVPVLLALIALIPGMQGFIILAILVHLVGITIERWLFFAEAKHTVGLYYGARSA